MGSKTKTKTNGTLNVRFSRALSKLQVIARNSDWFIALFDPILIDRSCEVWYRFFDSHLKPALSRSLGISCSKLVKCVKLHLGLFWKKKSKKKKKRFAKISSCVWPMHSIQWERVKSNSLYWQVLESVDVWESLSSNKESNRWENVGWISSNCVLSCGFYDFQVVLFTTGCGIWLRRSRELNWANRLPLAGWDS